MKFQSKKILILMIICNFAALVSYYFLFQYIKGQSETASSLTSTIDLSQQKNSHLNSLRLMVKDTEGQRQKLTTFLLSGDAEISFIEQMESLAKDSGLGVKTNNVSSIVGDTKVVKIFQIQLETTGGWSNTLYFLDQIENLPYDIHVQGVSLSKQSAIVKVAGSAWAAVFDISVVENI